MARTRKRKRGFSIWDLRWKLAAIITGVAVGVLTLGAYQAWQASIPKSRGQFLRKHYERFDQYRKGLGQSVAAVAELVALDPSLAAALVADDDASAAAAFQRSVTATRRTFRPDVILLVDRGGHPIHARGATHLDDSEVAQSRLIADVRGGMTVAAELAVIAGRLVQVSAAPVKDADGTVVGGVIVGVEVLRYMNDYREQSDPAASKQHRLTFVDTSGHVLSSVFPEDKHGALADSLNQENWRQDAEGDDMIPIIVFDDGNWDFWSAEARGYSGNEHGDLGTFFLLRTRDFKQAEWQEQVAESLGTFVWVGVLVFLFGLLVAWWITRRINAYVTATDELARGQGDLTRRLEVRGSDELARLAENLNDVFAYTHDLAAKVQSSAFQVGASSAEISAASQHMLEGAQEQARKTESSTAAVTELSASIQQVAENAMEATRVARSSGEAVQDAIGRMNEIRQTVEEAAARIQELGESGKRIGNIVEVIRQISDQTTLLALNAAIEAAHAGEQGRGFAVVADEVSGLAKRVGQSARDIEELIATIKEQTVEAVRAMETGTREVEAGTTLVTNTLSDLHTLVGVVEDTAKAVQEQAVASDEIARNMDVVQSIAQDVLGSSEEAVSQGEHLHRLAHDLEESVKGFKIRSGPPTGGHPALTSGDPD